MQVTQKKLEAFPPKSNPFNHDALHVGQNFGKNHMLMWSQDSSKSLKYFILIDTDTGKRIKFTVEADEEAELEDRPISDVESLRRGLAVLVPFAKEMEAEPEDADIAELRFDLEGPFPALENEPEGAPTS